MMRRFVVLSVLLVTLIVVVQAHKATTNKKFISLTFNLNDNGGNNSCVVGDVTTGYVSRKLSFPWAIQADSATFDPITLTYFIQLDQSIYYMDVTRGGIDKTLEAQQYAQQIFYDPKWKRMFGLFMLDSGDCFVGEIDMTTGTVKSLVPWPNTYSLIEDSAVYDPINHKYYVNLEDENNNNLLYTFDLVSNTSSKAPMVDSINGVQFELATNSLLAVSFTNNSLVRINPSTGAFSVLVSDVPGIPSSWSSLMDDTNSLYYIELIYYTDNFIIAVDTKTNQLVQKVKAINTFTYLYFLP
jgi:hypothetical protein